MLNIQKIVSMPEGKTVEYKRDLSSLNPILKKLVALAALALLVLAS